MIYEKKNIDIINIFDDKEKIHDDLIIDNCSINKLMISGSYFYAKVHITNSIINEFNALGRYFKGGLFLSNCIINKKTTFEAGGHNNNGVIQIENNIFNCYVDFFDAQYEGPFIFKNNILMNGSNLLGNLDSMIKTDFKSTCVIENNIGKIDLDYNPIFDKE
jgi:hypothetical protein